MWTREKSKEWIKETCGIGWLMLVDKVYDKLPDHITISQAYQKWGVLMFDIDQEDHDFEIFLEAIQDKSSSTCEMCGEQGTEVTLGNWVHTRCKAHLA